MAATDPARRRRAALIAGRAFADSLTPDQAKARMAKARAAQEVALIARADPDGTLTAEQRQQRVAELRREQVEIRVRRSVEVRAEKAARRRQAAAVADQVRQIVLDALLAADSAA